MPIEPAEKKIKGATSAKKSPLLKLQRIRDKKGATIAEKRSPHWLILPSIFLLRLPFVVIPTVPEVVFNLPNGMTFLQGTQGDLQGPLTGLLIVIVLQAHPPNLF